MTTQVMSFENAKYTLYRIETPGVAGVTIKMERYREPWPAGESQFVGNKFLNLLVDEMFEQKEILTALGDALKQATDRLEQATTDQEKLLAYGDFLDDVSRELGVTNGI